MPQKFIVKKPHWCHYKRLKGEKPYLKKVDRMATEKGKVYIPKHGLRGGGEDNPDGTTTVEHPNAPDGMTVYTEVHVDSDADSTMTYEVFLSTGCMGDAADSWGVVNMRYHGSMEAKDHMNDGILWGLFDGVQLKLLDGGETKMWIGERQLYAGAEAH